MADFLGSLQPPTLVKCIAAPGSAKIHGRLKISKFVGSQYARLFMSLLSYRPLGWLMSLLWDNGKVDRRFR